MSEETKEEEQVEGWKQAEERDNQMILGMMAGVGAQLYVNDYPNKKGGACCRTVHRWRTRSSKNSGRTHC